MNTDHNLTAVFKQDNDLCLTVRGTDNHLYYRTYDGATWSDWDILPGETLYEPATAYYQGELYIAIIGTEYNAIYVGSINLDTKVFSGWTWLPGASDSTPALTA